MTAHNPPRGTIPRWFSLAKSVSPIIFVGGLVDPPTESDFVCRLCPRSTFKDCTSLTCIDCPSGKVRTFDRKRLSFSSPSIFEQPIQNLICIVFQVIHLIPEESIYDRHWPFYTCRYTSTSRRVFPAIAR